MVPFKLFAHPWFSILPMFVNSDKIPSNFLRNSILQSFGVQRVEYNYSTMAVWACYTIHPLWKSTFLCATWSFKAIPTIKYHFSSWKFRLQKTFLQHAGKNIDLFALFYIKIFLEYHEMMSLFLGQIWLLPSRFPGLNRPLHCKSCILEILQFGATNSRLLYLN